MASRRASEANHKYCSCRLLPYASLSSPPLDASPRLPLPSLRTEFVVVFFFPGRFFFRLLPLLLLFLFLLLISSSPPPPLLLFLFSLLLSSSSLPPLLHLLILSSFFLFLLVFSYSSLFASLSIHFLSFLLNYFS